MAGNVVVAQRRGQGWRGGSFGLKLERKRKATEGLLWLFFVTGGRRGVKKLGEGAAAASLGFGRASSFFFLNVFFIIFCRVMSNGLLPSFLLF
jgi:hypothetical protein